MSSSESSRRFHFIREIASGGFGSVYLTKVIHADGFSRLVAVKLLHPRWSENEEIASRMRDEARLLGWLRHKNIVDVMDLTLIDGRCAVIMEYLDAVDLKVIITRCAEEGTRVPLRAALEICANVASALDAAYNRPPYAGEKPLRVIHRDIKPSNIMMDDSGVVKVLDFGVARAEFDERESKTQEMAFGSLEYMPPERLFFEPESPASDVYSLGATLFEMLALEKFGKAKLRPKEHEAYFEDRFDALLDAYPMHQETEDLLHELLMGLLAFDEPDRPSAADVVSQLRGFARRLKEGNLLDWAESVVPPLLRMRAEEPESKTPGSLVGAVLAEDSRALDQRSIWDENTGVSSRSVELGPTEDELTGRLADDARWKALKQATIEDMAKRGQLGPTTPEPTERETDDAPAARGAAVDPNDGDEEATLRAPDPKETLAPPEEWDDDPEDGPTIRAPILPPEDEDSELFQAKTVRLQRPELPPRVPRTAGLEQARPAAPAPLPPIPPAPPGPSGAKRLLGTVLFALLFGAGLAMVVFAIALLLTFGVIALTSQPAPPPPKVAPEPTEEPAPTNPSAPTGPHASFASARSGTARLKVNCTGGDGAGVDKAYVEGESLGTCTIVAVMDTGPRMRARLQDVSAGEYMCFKDNDSSCTGP